MASTIALLLSLHFLADFVLQSREMGKKKSQEPVWLFSHLAIQCMVFMLFVGWKFAIANAAIHGVIDWYIWRFYKLSVAWRFPDATVNNFKFWEDHLFFTTIGFDQLLHGLTLVLLAEWLL